MKPAPLAVNTERDSTPNMKNIIIAIDGYAGGGKSTTAKKVAHCLGYTYLDTGAMYRAVSLYFLQNGIPLETESARMKQALEALTLDFVRPNEETLPEITINGQPGEPYIRGKEVSEVVSLVARHKSVRDQMVAQQRRIGAQGGVVIDGRDIGTVVFPQAELKVFVEAALEERARRRLQELSNRGIEATLEEVIHNLKERDRIDSTREIAPLKRAEDAILLNTTSLTIDEQVRKVCELAQERMHLS